MNRYAFENAMRNLLGYFLPRPNEGGKAAFERAQVECYYHMQVAANNVKEITFEQFMAANKK